MAFCMERLRTDISCTMKHNRTTVGRILKGFGLPQELDAHRFFVQWIGGAECLIEQHRGILCFEAGRIRFSTEQGTLCVEGDSLELTRLTETRALVLGGIRTVSIEDKT